MIKWLRFLAEDGTVLVNVEHVALIERRHRALRFTTAKGKAFTYNLCSMPRWQEQPTFEHLENALMHDGFLTEEEGYYEAHN
jgi:hypothetical protein